METTINSRKAPAAFHNCAYDTLGVCAFAGFSITLDEFANMLNDVTGRDYKASDLERTSKRTLTMERLFNIREGLTRADDWLPDRYFDEPTPLGMPIARDKAIDREAFERMIDEYYELHGWDEQGVPRPETLKTLGLDTEPFDTI